jgi:hypothetical protein
MKHQWRSRKIKKSYKSKTRRFHKGGAQVKSGVQTINVRAEPLTPLNIRSKPSDRVFVSTVETSMFGKQPTVTGNPTGNIPMVYKLQPGGKTISIQFPGEDAPRKPAYKLEQPIQVVGKNTKQYYILRDDGIKYYLFKPLLSINKIYNVDLNKAIRSSVGEKMGNLSKKINPLTKIKSKYESIKKKFNGIIDPFSDKELDALGTIISNNEQYKKDPDTANIYNLSETEQTSLIKEMKDLANFKPIGPPVTMETQKILAFLDNTTEDKDNIQDLDIFILRLLENINKETPNEEQEEQQEEKKPEQPEGEELETSEETQKVNEEKVGGAITIIPTTITFDGLSKQYDSEDFIKLYLPDFKDDKNQFITFMYYLKQYLKEVSYDKVPDQYKHKYGPFTEDEKNTHLVYRVTEDAITCWIFYDITDSQITISELYKNNSPNVADINEVINNVCEKITPQVVSVKLFPTSVSDFEKNDAFNKMFKKQDETKTRDGYILYVRQEPVVEKKVEDSSPVVKQPSKMPEQNTQQPSQLPDQITQQQEQQQEPREMTQQQQPQEKQPEQQQQQQQQPMSSQLTPMKEDLKKPILDLISSLKKLVSTN